MKIYIETLKEKWKRPPKKQFPTGSRVYKGHQGMGKTLSMVKDAEKLLEEFPKAQVFSNVKIEGLKNFHYIDEDWKLKKALEYKNGADGVLIILDEAHLYFNKKSGISLDVLTCISQQRKDRRKIFFSTQIWEEMDISLRKQVAEIVDCRCIMGKFQWNKVLDGHTLSYNKIEGEYQAKKLYSIVFKHSENLYKKYDTFQKIVTNSEYNRPAVATQNNIILNKIK